MSIDVFTPGVPRGAHGAHSGAALTTAASVAEPDAAQYADAEIVTGKRDPDGLDADGVERERQARLARWHRQP